MHNTSLLGTRRRERRQFAQPCFIDLSLSLIGRQSGFVSVYSKVEVVGSIGQRRMVQGIALVLNNIDPDVDDWKKIGRCLKYLDVSSQAHYS